MSINELRFADATAQAAEIRSGTVSSRELTTAYLEAIESLDDALRSYVTTTSDLALDAADAADERVRAAADGDPLPPFLGVTTSFKDVVDVAGVATTHSCGLLADNVAAVDDPVVRRFRDAGFGVLGKTNVPEFCTSMTSSALNGICRNPWDLEATPGGSSGGAAAALAAGLCAVAHGTDGAGSVRVPAAFCGVVGVKPTRGLFTLGPEAGTAYYGASEDGVLTRSVRDAAVMLDVMATGRWSPVPDGLHADALHSAVTPLRVAVTADSPIGEVDPETAAAAHAAGDLLESLGHHVSLATPEWFTILTAADGPGSVPGMAGLVGPDDVEMLEPRNQRVWRMLAEMTVVDHADWVDRARRATREFCRFWDDIDVLVTPSCGIAAPSVGFAPWDQTSEEHMATFMGFPNFGQAFNVSGQPALSLPLEMHSSGLPIGVQLVGRHLEEPTLLRLAAQLEEARPWITRRPRGLEGLESPRRTDG